MLLLQAGQEAAQAERDEAVEKQEAMQRRMEAIIAEASKGASSSGGDGESSEDSKPVISLLAPSVRPS